MSTYSCRRCAVRRLRAILAASVPLLVCLLGPAPALATTISTSSVQMFAGPGGYSQDSGGSSSGVHVDSGNYAQSFVHPQLSQMGAGVASSVWDGNAFTRSSFDDSWTCKAPCGSFPLTNGIVPLSLSFDIDGVISDFGRPHGYGTGSPEIQIRATYTIGVLGALDFRLSENEFDSDEGVLGAGTRLVAKFCHTTTSCVDLPVDIQSYYDPDLDLDLFSFAVHASGLTLMCPGCAAGFVDEMFLQASVAGSPNVAMVDALHTFKVSVTSLDPDGQFVSAAGRSTAETTDGPPGSTAVPEPATLALVAAGLLGAGRRRWRRSP